MLARDGNGHDPGASGPFILRPEPKVAPPLERSESRRAECPSELLLLPNPQRGFVEADVSSALPLDDGQESRVVDSFSDILLVERENRDLRTVAGSIIHLRSVPTYDLVTPLYQGEVDGKSPAGDVEDFSTDRMAMEQMSQKGRRSSDAPRFIQSVKVFCDDPIPTGVGLSLLTSREPHVQ